MTFLVSIARHLVSRPETSLTEYEIIWAYNHLGARKYSSQVFGHPRLAPPDGTALRLVRGRYFSVHTVVSRHLYAVFARITWSRGRYCEQEEASEV